MPENWHYCYYKTQALKTQTPENWLSYACLYINCHSMKTIRPTELHLVTHYKIPVQMTSELPTNFEGTNKHPKVKIFPSSLHLSTRNWIIFQKAQSHISMVFGLIPNIHSLLVIKSIQCAWKRFAHVQNATL